MENSLFNKNTIVSGNLGTTSLAVVARAVPPSLTVGDLRVMPRYDAVLPGLVSVYRSATKVPAGTKDEPGTAPPPD